jgi:hypothetical protein
MLLELRCPGLFARDLIIQLTSHDYLKKLCVTLIAANAPDHFPVREGQPSRQAERRPRPQESPDL